MKVVATLTSKGQLTVPKIVRRTLGVSRGDGVEFAVERGQVRLRAVRPARSSSGLLHKFLPAGWKAPTVKEMDVGIARHFANAPKPRRAR